MSLPATVLPVAPAPSIWTPCWPLPAITLIPLGDPTVLLAASVMWTPLSMLGSTAGFGDPGRTPIRFPTTLFPVAAAPVMSTPSVWLPEIWLPLPACEPPIVAPLERRSTPAPVLPRDACPVRLVPILLPWMTAPVAPAPAICTPSAPLAEITFPWPALRPPMAALGAPETAMPLELFPAMLPFPSSPITLPVIAALDAWLELAAIPDWPFADTMFSWFAVEPPTVAVADWMKMPSASLGSAPTPDALRPIVFPTIEAPAAPAPVRMMPCSLLPEITLRCWIGPPPMITDGAPDTDTPGPTLPTSVPPVASVPIRFPSTCVAVEEPTAATPPSPLPEITFPPPAPVLPTMELTAPALTSTPASVFGMAVEPSAPTPMKLPATALFSVEPAPVPENSTPFW